MYQIYCSCVCIYVAMHFSSDFHRIRTLYVLDTNVAAMIIFCMYCFFRILRQIFQSVGPIFDVLIIFFLFISLFAIAGMS